MKLKIYSGIKNLKSFENTFSLLYEIFLLSVKPWVFFVKLRIAKAKAIAHKMIRLPVSK